MLDEPTTTEWWAAGIAAALVVLVGGLLFIRPALRPAASGASRIAGFLLAAQAVAVVVVAAVLVGAGIRASSIEVADDGTFEPLTGPFARFLFSRPPDTIERVAGYGAAVLLPLAGVLGVLALAAVDLGRSIGLRVIAALVCGAMLVTSVLVVVGDAGPLAGRAAIGVALLAGGAATALAADELSRPRSR